MALSLTHTRNEKTAPHSHRTPGFASLELKWEAVTLFRYIYDPDMPQSESPKPFFHPVNTLAGDLITNYRPHDHVWHKGIQMTIAHLDGQNFWGGGQLPPRRGLRRPAQQRQPAPRRLGFDRDRGHPLRGTRRRLSWITQAGKHWIDETRCIAVETVDPDAGYWALDFTTSLRNVRGKSLHIGSPTTAGRPLAGYGGLFWRGPRSFDNGEVITAAGHEGADAMGKAAPWLAYTGRHDGNGHASTLAFLDHPANLRYPNKWFIRQTPYACASFAFMFDQVYEFASGGNDYAAATGS